MFVCRYVCMYVTNTAWPNLNTVRFFYFHIVISYNFIYPDAGEILVGSYLSVKTLLIH